MPDSFKSHRRAKKLKESAKELADGKLVQEVKLLLARSALWVGKLITFYRRMKECRPVPREDDEMEPLLQLEE